MDELDKFSYEQYKENGFEVNKLGDFDLKIETEPDGYCGIKVETVNDH